MMYDVLYQYLVLHKKLSLPGLGRIAVEKKPAQSDTAGNMLLSPVYSFVFDRDRDTPSKKLFIWLANMMQSSEWDAIKKVNDFSFEIKQQLNAGIAVEWNGIGVLRRTGNGEIELDADKKELPYEPAVPAEKLMRKDAEHATRSFEEKLSSLAAEDVLQEKPKRSYWRAVSLIISIILLIFLGIYFSQKGINVNAAGLQKQAAPQEAPKAYKQVQ